MNIKIRTVSVRILTEKGKHPVLDTGCFLMYFGVQTSKKRSVFPSPTGALPRLLSKGRNPGFGSLRAKCNSGEISREEYEALIFAKQDLGGFSIQKRLLCDFYKKEEESKIIHLFLVKQWGIY